MLKLINDRNKEDHRRGDAVLKDNQTLKINMDVFQVHKLKGFWGKVLKKRRILGGNLEVGGMARR